MPMLTVEIRKGDGVAVAPDRSAVRRSINEVHGSAGNQAETHNSPEYDSWLVERADRIVVQSQGAVDILIKLFVSFFSETSPMQKWILFTIRTIQQFMICARCLQRT